MLNIRSDFPILDRRIDGQGIVYLDSAATTLKPTAVIEAENLYNAHYSANIHRGKHTLSQEASQAYEEARIEVADFINADQGEVVFVKNASEALNLVAYGLKLSSSDNIVVPVGEHHSNILPWMQHGCVQFYDHKPGAKIDVDTFRQFLINKKAKVAAFTATSNVTGVVNPINELASICRELGIISVVDASQYVPHFATDVKAIDCDFLAFSGHKLLGPSGIGVLYAGKERLAQLRPLMLGGGCVDRVTTSGYVLKEPPYCFEAGTPPIAAAIGLAAAVRYLKSIGFKRIQQHEQTLREKLSQVFTPLFQQNEVVGHLPDELAMISFALPKVVLSADDIAEMLSHGDKIMLRSGHHCCHPLHDALGLANGSIRLSAYIYNNEADIDKFAAALQLITDRFSLAA